MFNTFNSISAALNTMLSSDNNNYSDIKITDLKLELDDVQKQYILFKDGVECGRIAKDELDNFNYTKIFNMLSQLLEKEIYDENHNEQNDSVSEESNVNNTPSEEPQQKETSAETTENDESQKGSFASKFTNKFSNYKKQNTYVLGDMVFDDLKTILANGDLSSGVKYTLLYDDIKSDVCDGIRLVYYRNSLIDVVKNSFKNPINVTFDYIIQHLISYIDTTVLQDYIKKMTGFSNIKLSLYEGFENSHYIMNIVLCNNEEIANTEFNEAPLKSLN